MLEGERREYEAEIEASFEPPEVVKQRLFNKARELKRRNEEERRRQAAELEARRFRQSSDVLRARDSAIIAQRMADDRVDQLREKAERGRREFEEGRRAELALLDAAARRGEREKEEAAKKKAEESKLRAELDAQVLVKEELVRRARAHDSAVDEDALGRWRREAEAAERAEAERRQAARDELARTRAENARHEGLRREASLAEFEADKARIADAVRRGREVEERDAMAARERAATAKAHRAALERQMAVEAEAGDRFDGFFAAYQEKQWAKREAVWAAQAEARRRLDEEVAQTRARQLADKTARAEWEAVEDARVAEAVAERNRLRDADDEARKAAVRDRGAQQRRDLQVQARRRSDARAREKQTDYLQVKLQQREEERYQARVEKLLAEPPRDDGHRRRKPLIE